MMMEFFPLRQVQLAICHPGTRWVRWFSVVFLHRQVSTNNLSRITTQWLGSDLSLLLCNVHAEILPLRHHAPFMIYVLVKEYWSLFNVDLLSVAFWFYFVGSIIYSFMTMYIYSFMTMLLWTLWACILKPSRSRLLQHFVCICNYSSNLCMSIDNSVQLDGVDEGAEHVARSILDSIVDTIVTGVCRII